MGISSSLISRFLFIFIFTICFFSNRTPASSGRCCLKEQKALLVQLKNDFVYDSLVSRKLVRWNHTEEEDCCRWYGVECDEVGRVIGLQLENEGISSGIPSSLFNLRYLEKLNLSFNSLDDTQIPMMMHNISHLPANRLASLDLSSGFLKIEIPYLKMLLKNFTGLRELYLDDIDISSHGSQWCHILSSSLPHLSKLSLRQCGLSGPLHPSLLQLHSLSVLHLDVNNLRTTVPDFFANFSSLTTLTLLGCSLHGHFPNMIFQVPTLQHLDLSENKLLSGTIPQVHQNQAFRTIILRYTNFSGSLPNSIGNLSMLSTINLSNCNFTGRVPSALANLTELAYVDLSRNEFIGSIPSFYMSTKLQYIDLSVNKFTGSIPSFYMFKKLQYIDLSFNNFTGSLSFMHFEGDSHLGYLNLAFNSLSGRIPQSVFALPSLQTLALSHNQFSGQVLDLHSSYMIKLDLSSNRLEGSIPQSFFKLKRLQILSLSHNFFNGTFKLEKIRGLHDLKVFELSHNNVSVDARNISSSLPAFPQLNSLGLASCNLYNFPNLRNQSRLFVLDLSNNHITGEIPSWIWNPHSELSTLNLSLNLLVDLKRPYNTPRSLGILDLHSNQLRGRLPLLPPEAFYVDFSNNHFERSIQPFQNFSSLDFISLANNSLSGAIPTSVCSAIYLQALDLSDNSFVGSIPPCIFQDMKDLKVLNMGRNNIDGDIPDKFSVKCGLHTLDLSDNKLGGNIPPSLTNCKSLEVMNVGNNKIHGGFPCMLPSSLRVLVLRSNRFHGEVRCRKGWPNLQIIDIAVNNFSGRLYQRSFKGLRGITLGHDPHELTKNGLRFVFSNPQYYYQNKVRLIIKGKERELVKILSIFTSIDFSCNNFHGEIPHAIGHLSSLYILNLSHNSFTGTIPRTIGNLTQLGSLDLSMNQLSGQIPMEFAGLTFLSIFNVSYNKLVGMIPNGPQFSTFPAASFEGNTGLCGFPVKKSCKSTVETGAPTSELDQDHKEIEWSYVSAALGFGVGLGGIIWLLWCS